MVGRPSVKRNGAREVNGVHYYVFPRDSRQYYYRVRVNFTFKPFSVRFRKDSIYQSAPRLQRSPTTSRLTVNAICCLLQPPHTDRGTTFAANFVELGLASTSSCGMLRMRDIQAWTDLDYGVRRSHVKEYGISPAFIEQFGNGRHIASVFDRHGRIHWWPDKKAKRT